MKIEFISDYGKDLPVSLIEKAVLIADTLSQLFVEVEIFKYSESYQINISATLSSTIPTKEQADLFIEEVKKSTNINLTMFRYKPKEIDTILISLNLIRVFHGYSTTITEIGKYMWTVSLEKIDFERIK